MSSVVSPSLLVLLEALIVIFVAWILILAVLSCFEYFKVFCILMPICAVWPRRVTLVCVCACYYSAIAYCPTYVHQRDKNKLKLHQCGSH